MQTETREEMLARLERKANQMRQRVMTTLLASGGGHVGGSMSAMEVLTALYYEVMRVDPKNPKWDDRDRFVLSKGHISCALCPVLADLGFFPDELLDSFNLLDSPFSMHPDMRKIPGVDMSTGSLGHGLAVATGMALAAGVEDKTYRVYALLGDGELGEGSVWEAAMAAAHFRLDRLTAIIDRNGLQVDGTTDEVMSTEPLAGKWRAFNWAVREIDGHDMAAVVDALKSTPFEAGKPSMIIANTVKGKGLSFAENKVEWHYNYVSKDVVEKALGELKTSEVGR
jgi:transketolase